MDIPKPDGGVRTSGIPTVVDRLIQQAVKPTQRYIRGGKWWAVDMDSGEVLRPGGLQTPDDASGQNDKGQAGAVTDTL
ncbi:hypothetical protein PL329_23005 [Escherichia coli]|uniref:hypothetical protein n=1 Tax=Escherichia coli TaxID=562 RepID=UPI002306E314|nr:hypothetical protein [Escherichia coli]WCE53736.1 hypothetical protein PL329_23005 [Escherichia coli]